VQSSSVPRHGTQRHIQYHCYAIELSAVIVGYSVPIVHRAAVSLNLQLAATNFAHNPKQSYL